MRFFSEKGKFTTEFPTSKPTQQKKLGIARVCPNIAPIYPNILIEQNRTMDSLNDTINEKKIFKRDISTVAKELRLLSRKNVLQVYFLLTENKEMTVTEIQVRMRLDQPVVSQVLATLRRSGLVKTTRLGKNIYYRPVEEKFRVLELVVTYAKRVLPNKNNETTSVVSEDKRLTESS